MEMNRFVGGAQYLAMIKLRGDDGTASWVEGELCVYVLCCAVLLS